MKKLIFGIIFLFCVNSYAINGFSIYKMYTQYDTVTHTNLDSNLNRPASWSSLLVDTLDRKFIRFSDLTNGDTTLSSIKVDTIRSNPYIDSTKGNTIHTGNYTTTGSMTVDTLKSTKGINATGGTFSGRITGSDIQLSDSVKAVYGDFSGVLEVDSLKSTKGINATGGTFSGRITGSDIQLSDSVKAVYGDFSGALEVDSLKSIKGINATGGTFSGRITGTDIDVSDTVKGGTGTFSGALTSQTLNTGNGDNELYPMDQDMRTTASPTHVLGTYTDGVRAYNATSSGSYVGLFKGPGALPGFSSSYFPTLKTDYSSLYFSAGGFYAAAMAKEVFAIPDSTGKHHIFSVEKDTTTAKIIKADSIKLGTGSYLKTYAEGTFPCTLKTSDVTVQQVGTVGYTITGNIVTLSIPNIKGTSNSSTLILYCGSIPSTIEPSKYVNGSTMVFNSGGFDVGTWRYYSVIGKFFTFNMPGGAGFTSSGTKGFGFAGFDNSTTITYTK